MSNLLSERTRGRLEAYLSSRPDVVAAILFGSRARGEERKGSDLDIGILLTREQAQAGVNRSQLVTDLMEVFGRADVDAVILNDAPPLLQHRVVRDGHVLYSRDDGAVAEFTVRAIQRYEDTRPLRKLQAEQLRRRLALHRSEREGSS